MTETTVDNKLMSLLSDSTSRLKEKLGSIWRFLTFSPAETLFAHGKNLTIAIEKGSVSFAYASKLFSKVTIKDGRTYSFESARYPQPHELVSSLELSINEMGVGKADLTLSIPKSWAIIRGVELPSTVQENLADALSYEMDRLTPFPAEEVFYDYKILKESHDKIHLLLLAVRTDIIKPYLEALREDGFNISNVTVNLAGIATLCEHIYKDNDIIFVDISRDGSEAALFLDGTLNSVLSDGFSTSSLQLERLKGYDTTDFENLLKKIRKLKDNADEAKKTPQIVLNLQETIPDIRELLELKIGVQAKILGESDAYSGLKATYSGLMISDREISYAAIGNSMQSLYQGLEAPDMLKRGKRKKEGAPIALTIILLIAIAFVWAFYTVAPIGIEEKRFEEISKQIDIRRDDINKIEAIKKETEALVSEISFINGFKGDIPVTLTILRELTSILPHTAWLAKAKITENSVEVTGYALSATELLPKLEESKYFSKVEFTSPTIRDRIMNSDRFMIKMDISTQLGHNKAQENNEEK